MRLVESSLIRISLPPNARPAALKWPEKDNILLYQPSLSLITDYGEVRRRKSCEKKLHNNCGTFSDGGERLRFPLRAFDSLCSVSWRGEEEEFGWGGKAEGERWGGEEESDWGVERGLLAIDRGRARDWEVGGEEEGVARVGRVARACGLARVRSPGQGWPPIPLSPTCGRDLSFSVHLHPNKLLGFTEIY